MKNIILVTRIYGKSVMQKALHEKVYKLNIIKSEPYQSVSWKMAMKYQNFFQTS